MAKLCEVLNVSRCGYYAWNERPKSNRTVRNEQLLKDITKIHIKSKTVYGGKKIKNELAREGQGVNHKRVERLMRENGIRSKVARKWKATINSRHSLPVAENLLNREFQAEKPN